MVHPSYVEGIPQSVMGGMAGALPVVASNVGGLAEIIDHGRTGLLIKENDVDGFSEAVMGLLPDPPRPKALGPAAPAAISPDLSPEPPWPPLPPPFPLIPDSPL